MKYEDFHTPELKLMQIVIDRHQRALKVAIETMERLGPDSNLLEWATQEIEAILRGDEGDNI